MTNKPTILFIILALSGVCFLTANSAPAQTNTSSSQTEATLPVDTPAGKLLAGWLEAFNTGQRANFQKFVAENFAAPPNTALPVERITDRQFGIFDQSGGFIVRKVANSAPDKISVYAEAKLTGFWMVITVFADTSSSLSKIMGMGFRNTEMPADLLPKEKLSDAQIRAKIDQLISVLIKNDAFSGVIMIAKDGKPIYQRVTGTADRTWNIANRIDTKFNVASIGKMFTAVAIARLVEDGKLSYDDTLAKILPDYPNKEIAEKITIRHLLSHTSGITEGKTDTNGEGVMGSRERRTIKENLPTKPGDTLKFEPGTKLEYSNYGYLLLGAVIEKASGEDYYTYIRKHIYQPAGMTDTDSFELDTEPANLANGYMDGPNHTRLNNIFKLGVKGMPFGGGYATAEDLVRFSTALRTGKLVKPETLDTIWTGRMAYTEPDSQYGYGFIVKKYNGTRIIGHGGGWFGITNKFDMYRDLGYTVVVLNNIDSDPNSIAFKLREWLTQGAQN